ncbi:TPA: DUF551 domain-containing protein [Escherichia coli]|uniref:DUF551 domain-containing protein n=1 Tax=Escherichia coli TaxID=562 RepID=UPI001845410C|nr:DUF551 domain-containing protein [Escherichia coli]HAH7005864.1 DUF551 domain-containing protein [Escherichia coli]
MTTLTDKELIKEIRERIGSLDVRDNIERRAYEIALASLEAEPVSQTYNLPQTHFEQVADLYEMQFDDGRTCAFHTDAQKAAQWLRACDGNRVQEYVKLERLQNALSGNSPVIPDSWISCSERMPDDGQEVVVQTHSGWRYIAFYESHSGLFYDSPEGDVEYVLVTHWMPLPEPPQEVNRG